MSSAIAIRLTSHKALNSPPSLPLNPIVLQPRLLASFSALITLVLLPPVLIPIATSSSFARAST